MGDKRDPDHVSPESADFTDPEAVDRRVWRNIFAVIAIAVVAAAIFADMRFMLGLVVGGALALINYKWLHSSVRGILAVSSGKAPPGVTVMFVVRWLVVGIAAYLSVLTGYVDPIAILGGLFAPAVAIMVEAIYSTYKTIARGENDT